MPVYEMRDGQGEVVNRILCAHEDAAALAPAGTTAHLIRETNESDDQALDRLRRQRDRRLAETDWSEVAPTLPADEKTAWRAYRQQLRDLPETTANPHAPLWPEKQTGRPGDAASLAAWRKVAAVYRWQFAQALDLIPAPAHAPAPATSLADWLTAVLPAHPDLARALDMITRHERLHPDMAAFATATGLDATAMDQLFALGIAIEAGRVSDAAEAQAVLAEWQGT